MEDGYYYPFPGITAGIIRTLVLFEGGPYMRKFCMRNVSVSCNHNCVKIKKALAPMCTLFFLKIHKTLKDEKENCYASLSSLFLLMRMHIEMGIESRKSDCGAT